MGRQLKGGDMLTALISVYEKEGLVDFLKRLEKLDQLKIFATASTLKFLREHGFDGVGVEDLTKFPEILGGRVKTLHPKVFGGILARATKEDEEQLKQFDIPKVDLVVVNLYPFEEKLKANLTQSAMIEFIDIGGVSLLRAAAKNFERVVVVSLPNQYQKLALEFEHGKGTVTRESRQQLAQEAFRHTHKYDEQIANYLLPVETGERKMAESMPPLVNIR